MPIDRPPGWDSRAIQKVADEFYGGYAGMNKAHGWPTTGSKIMPGTNGRVKSRYGSIESFIAAHHTGRSLTLEEMWDGRLTVMLTSFWGWSPETWGTVGFTAEGRRDTIVAESTDPFIMVIYVTKTARGASADIKGMITGFYLVSHIAGHRNDFTDPSHFDREPEKWQHSLKAIRAFDFLPEYRLHIDDFDPSASDRARAIASSGEILPTNLIEKLKALPVMEVPVFDGYGQLDAGLQIHARPRHMVRAGPANRSGYMVSGEPLDTEKELYALALEGDTDTFLGEPAGGRRIFKIGLSISPQSRLAALQKALPNGTYRWTIHRSTRKDRHDPYPCFEAAEAGETAMKQMLAQQVLTHNTKWLGGEFYAATDENLESAWEAGRKHALAWSEGNLDDET